MEWSHPGSLGVHLGVLVSGILIGVFLSGRVGGQALSDFTQGSQELLDELVAKDAIQKQIYNYARGLDRMDKELAYQIWHPDGTAHYIGSYEGTGRGLVDSVWSYHETLVAHSHQITNVLIEVDGNDAASESYVMASLHANPAEDRATTRLYRSRYADRWSKRDGRWAVDRRVAIGDFMTKNEGTGPNQSTEGRRDRTDPSYEIYPH